MLLSFCLESCWCLGIYLVSFFRTSSDRRRLSRDAQRHADNAAYGVHSCTEAQQHGRLTRPLCVHLYDPVWTIYLLLASSYIINWVITKEKLRTFWFFWYMSKHPSKLAHTYKQKIGALGPVLLAGTTTHQACNQMKTHSKLFLSSQLKTCKSHGQKK